MRRPMLRAMLTLPPALLGLASLVTLAVAPFSWGAGGHAGLSPWVPPATAAGFGLPALLIADWSVRRIRAKTAWSFSLEGGLTVFALMVMPVAIVNLIIIALGVTDARTYDALAGAGDEPDLSAASYLMSTAMFAALLNSLVWAALAIYVSAIQPHRPGHHDRGAGEVDGVGVLLGRRNQTF